MNFMRKGDADIQKANRTEVTPVTRVAETEDAFTLTVELPGVSEKEIDITLENRTLSITAEITTQRFEGYEQVLCEIAEVRYRAAFDLPEHVETSGVKASTKDGLLVLTLPKREAVKPKRIAIAAG